MNEEEMKAQLQDLLAQVAALTSRAEQAEKERDDQKQRADAASGERDSLKAKYDEMAKERVDSADVAQLKDTIKGLTDRLRRAEKARMDADDPERIRKAVQARVQLEGKAVTVLGDEARFDSLSDRQVMVAVIEKLQGAVVNDTHSDDYVRARFDSATESFAQGREALARARKVAETGKQERNDAVSARQKMIERNQNAWKPAGQQTA